MPVPNGYTLDQPVKLPPGYTLDGGADVGGAAVAANPFGNAPAHASGGVSKGLLGNLSDAVGAGLHELGGVISGPYHAFADAPRDAQEQQVKGTNSGSGAIARGLGQFGLGAYRMTAEPTVQGVQQGIQAAKRGDKQAERRAFGSAVPIAGPMLQSAQQRYDTQGPGAALGGLLTDAGIAGAMPEVPGALKAIPGIPRALLASGVDEVMPGQSITPRQRFQAAQRLGVKLDAADATNSAPLKVAKAVNQHSLLGSGTYERAQGANLQALDRSANSLLDTMSPLDAQAGGKLIQNRLLANQNALKTGAAEGFDRLDQMTGGAPVPGAATVGKWAQDKLAENQPFYTKYSSLAPNTAISVLKDLGKVGDTASYGELQRLRSNVHEMTSANPDLVKDDSTGWLQQATGNLDNAITDKALAPSQVPVFRKANANWAEMKSTYDNPQNPLYQAVRNTTPDTLANGIGTRTVSQLQDLAPRIGPDGLGVLRRGVAENALGRTSDGAYNFKTFGTKLNRFAPEYRSELFGDQNAPLNDLATTSNILSRDVNPSGTAKMGQKLAEAQRFVEPVVALTHPGATAAVLGQYPLAKLMNSERFVNYLMREPGASGPTLPPVAPVTRQNGPSPQPSPAPAIPSASIPPPQSPYLNGAAQPSAASGGALGAATKLLTPTLGDIPAKYRVVEADSLIPSHNAMNFKPVAEYPSGVQERDYAGQKENQLRVIQNAQNYKPELTVTDNPDGVNGPPVVTPHGVVLGGNSRVMSTQRLYMNDGANYKSYLASKAPSFGLTPEQVNALHRPMLVREVPSADSEMMRRLGSDLNRSLMGSMGGSERAVSLGKSISPQTLSAVQAMTNEAGPGASLRDVLSDPARSNAFLRKMQEDGVITSQERPQFVDSATGGMTEDGKRLFERALLGSVLGDSSLMESAPKNVLGKLNASIGPLASLASRGDEWNIVPALRNAVAAHARMAASGVGVDDFLRQKSVFTKPLTPVEEYLTRILGDNPNAVRDAFNAYGRDSQAAPEGQSNMFGGPAAHDSFNHAFGARMGPGEFAAR